MSLRRVLLIALAAAGVVGLAGLIRDDSYLRRRIRDVRIAAMSYPRFAPQRYDYFRLDGTRLTQPTVLALGPDGRLYVAERDGLIHAYTVERSTLGYRATGDEHIDAIRVLPNHDDLGRARPEVEGRLVTGLVATGTPQAPILYVSSSDPRIDNRGIDTNSGIVSRLDRADGGWRRTDLVRGLPRSRVDHAGHGLALDRDRGVLYLAQGGNTNRGAPSEFFHDLPEYALAGTILEIDLNALERLNLPYDLPTLDDEDRPGNPDRDDPFGGNGGKNQAVATPGGPVRIHASGFRNPYDLVLAETGLYVTDNGANADFGGKPQVEENGGVLNTPVENGRAVPNGVHRVAGPGYYGGHPNPTRADSRNRFNASNPQSPVATVDVRQAVAIPPRRAAGIIAVYPRTTDGIAAFDPGDDDRSEPDWLIAVGRTRALQRIRLSEDGARALRRGPMMRNLGVFPLDIVAQDADAPVFPRTLWISDFATGVIHVVEVQAAGPRTVGQQAFDALEALWMRWSRIAGY